MQKAQEKDSEKVPSHLSEFPEENVRHPFDHLPAQKSPPNFQIRGSRDSESILKNLSHIISDGGRSYLFSFPVSLRY